MRNSGTKDLIGGGGVIINGGILEGGLGTINGGHGRGVKGNPEIITDSTTKL